MMSLCLLSLAAVCVDTEKEKEWWQVPPDVEVKTKSRKDERQRTHGNI